MHIEYTRLPLNPDLRWDVHNGDDSDRNAEDGSRGTATQRPARWVRHRDVSGHECAIHTVC